MPVIRTTLLQGFSTTEERSELAIRLADALIDVYGEIARPYTYSIVDEVPPGAWYLQGHLATTEMITQGFVEARQFRAKRVTRERRDAAYTALASGDRTAIEEDWDQDMTWLVPGESRISGIKKGLDEFLSFMKLVGELSGNSAATKPWISAITPAHEQATPIAGSRSTSHTCCGGAMARSSKAVAPSLAVGAPSSWRAAHSPASEPHMCSGIK